MRRSTARGGCDRRREQAAAASARWGAASMACGGFGGGGIGGGRGLVAVSGSWRRRRALSVVAGRGSDLMGRVCPQPTLRAIPRPANSTRFRCPPRPPSNKAQPPAAEDASRLSSLPRLGLPLTPPGSSADTAAGEGRHPLTTPTASALQHQPPAAFYRSLLPPASGPPRQGPGAPVLTQASPPRSSSS